MNTPKEMDCFECGKGSLIPKMVKITGYRHGEEFTVLVNGLQCTGCGLGTIDNDYSGEFTKLISDAYREKHGLLTGTQIREARNRLGMSQEKFAQYLKVGPASVNRWENGKIQDEAMNELILVKTDLLTATSNYQIVKQSATMGLESALPSSAMRVSMSSRPSQRLSSENKRVLSRSKRSR